MRPFSLLALMSSLFENRSVSDAAALAAAPLAV
jgi:hypothetical protein